ncbi:hypothetical protein HPB51_002236 [Rhipicephalus microplus]|uniref:Uncharacterized protein n=1 Tax=Rhipicephalus microplus TaxID=6941 RepID=A0A9J6EWS4_RHIMP|nr:hypothetical protein HPB51_002236 [Rhipicephalus microplus]
MTRALVAGDSMLKDLAGSFALSSMTHVEVRSFSGVRIEKLFSLIAHSLGDVHVIVLPVGTNSVDEEPLAPIASFRSLISRILDVNPSIRVVVSAILPRQASLRKCQWALSVEELEAFHTDAGETNDILQALCHKNSYGFMDGTRELMGILTPDGVNPTKRGSQLLGCPLRAVMKQASKDLEASHNEALQQQHQRGKDHKKLRFQCGDQSEGPAQYWNNVTNFPALSAEPMLVAAPASTCKEMWSDLARKSASATIQCHSAMSAAPKVAETDTTCRYPLLPLTSVASTIGIQL